MSVSSFYKSSYEREYGRKSIKKSESESRLVVSNSLQPCGIYNPCNSPGQNTGVGSHFLLQGIFPNQGLNRGLPHCRWIIYQLSHQGHKDVEIIKILISHHSFPEW